jgi:hypothetical protein
MVVPALMAIRGSIDEMDETLLGMRLVLSVQVTDCIRRYLSQSHVQRFAVPYVQ